MIKKGDTHRNFTAIKPSNNPYKWWFRCKCGNIVELYINSVIKEQAVSCGCLKPQTKHGMRNTRIYNIWKGIKQRCLNPNSTRYPRYGGRGIFICEIIL